MVSPIVAFFLSVLATFMCGLNACRKYLLRTTYISVYIRVYTRVYIRVHVRHRRKHILHTNSTHKNVTHTLCGAGTARPTGLFSATTSIRRGTTKPTDATFIARTERVWTHANRIVLRGFIVEAHAHAHARTHTCARAHTRRCWQHTCRWRRSAAVVEHLL